MYMWTYKHYSFTTRTLKRRNKRSIRKTVDDNMNYEIIMICSEFEEFSPLAQKILKQYWWSRDKMLLEFRCPNFSPMMFVHFCHHYKIAVKNLLKLRSLEKRRS